MSTRFQIAALVFIVNRRRGQAVAAIASNALKAIKKGQSRGGHHRRRSGPLPGVDSFIHHKELPALVEGALFGADSQSGRHFATWIGLVPQQNGTGGKVHLGGISKKGEPYLRRLLVLGATAVVRYARNKPEFAGWVNALLARRPARVVTVAVANKLARIVWAVMRRSGSFRQRSLGIA